MSLEVGNIVEGTVTGITNFGAFVELPGEVPVWSIFRKSPMPTSTM